jgi:hypothetical protein
LIEQICDGGSNSDGGEVQRQEEQMGPHDFESKPP